MCGTLAWREEQHKAGAAVPIEAALATLSDHHSPATWKTLTKRMVFVLCKVPETMSRSSEMMMRMK